MSEGHEENQDMQRISKKIKNCEACLSEDTLCVPQRVLQQREKNVVEAGEKSRVRRGHQGLLCACFNRHNDFECPKDTNKTIHIYAPAYIIKDQSTGGRPVIRDHDRGRGRVRGRDRDRWPWP